jgi:ubiquinone/menaquinone biosynthesis C-methylase UbiE
MPPELALGYLAEMVRVCRPSGFIVVQIVTKRTGPPGRRGSWYWPPTVAKLAWRAFNRRMAIATVVEMFPIPESTVRNAFADAGADILAAWPDNAAGSSFESLLFVARPRNRV